MRGLQAEIIFEPVEGNARSDARSDSDNRNDLIIVMRTLHATCVRRGNTYGDA
jgi:hypothetical protein